MYLKATIRVARMSKAKVECRTEGNYIVVPKGLVNVIVDETSTPLFMRQLIYF